jgi:hypothetical protein
LPIGNDEEFQMSKFRADCSRCCGLCCVVHDLFAVQGFPNDKPANTPCIYLNACDRCSIHGRRLEHGYGACEGFDCFGDGQWITQALFAGASWRESPELAMRMFAAYRRWAPRFEAAALLEAALPHVPDAAARCLLTQIDALTRVEDSEQGSATDAARLRRETLALIRSLGPERRRG